MIYLTFISRALLALVFIASAAGKSRHPGVLQETIRKIGFPSRLARIAGPLVISYEAISRVQIATSHSLQLLWGLGNTAWYANTGTRCSAPASGQHLCCEYLALHISVVADDL
jgi:hypothetical protein